MAPSSLPALLVLGLPAGLSALEDGLARTPPMGWRSWNLYGENVDQQLMEAVMDAMVARKNLVDGQPTSLCDLGYCDVGLDDNWQDCKAGTDGFNYHARTDQGLRPVVNLQRFPDMAAMTQHGHQLGLTVGWYGNNCICKETRSPTPELYQGDVQALVEYGFDGVKLDHCGTEFDLDTWSDLISKTGRPVVIENCHWGDTVPTDTWCPWHFFRSSVDIRAIYRSVMTNLQSTVVYAQKGLSRPGCWAYPDALQVGVAHGPGGWLDPGLSDVEARAHFGAWCITSSPLILAFNVTDDAAVAKWWPLIANVEAIAINQAWAGHSGSPFKEGGRRLPVPYTLKDWQFFYKPLGDGRVAVLLINHDFWHKQLVLDFADVPGLGCTKCKVRDVWNRSDLGSFDGSITAEVDSHDAAFYVLSADAAVVV